jgi:hypothetical protein
LTSVFRKAWTSLCLVLLVSVACSDRTQEEQPSRPADLIVEYDRLRADNAVLRARLSLRKLDVPYLVLSLPDKEIRLEMSGLVLTRSPIRSVTFNRRAGGISHDTTRIAISEIPFVLQDEYWYEEAPTLALKDSAAVMSRPDTTGQLVEQIRQARVMALLEFDRDLAIALNGQSRPSSIPARLKSWLRGMVRPMRPGSGVWPLRTMQRRSVFVELKMEPAVVRSLAPNLRKGTRLVVQF